MPFLLAGRVDSLRPANAAERRNLLSVSPMARLKIGAPASWRIGTGIRGRRMDGLVAAERRNLLSPRRQPWEIVPTSPSRGAATSILALWRDVAAPRLVFLNPTSPTLTRWGRVGTALPDGPSHRTGLVGPHPALRDAGVRHVCRSPAPVSGHPQLSPWQR